jgi:hypothetical protein
MKTKILLFIFVGTFLFEGCTPSMNLSVRYSSVDTTESELFIHFNFERIKKSETQPLDLTRIWIYKDNCLFLELQRYKFFDEVQDTWDFPLKPKGFKIMYPENLNTMPTFTQKDHLKFNFLAGGSYSSWEHKPKP